MFPYPENFANGEKNVSISIPWRFSSPIPVIPGTGWHSFSPIQAIFVLAIKFIIKRSRPAGDWGAIYRNSDPHSFPSGHATRAAMLAVLFWGLQLNPLAILITIWVFLVSFARVILGVHYLSDIVAGWILGVLLGLSMLWLQPFFYSILPWAFFR